MGKREQSIGMVLCIALAMASQFYSSEINDLFQRNPTNTEDSSAPLVGLQSNESWLVVLVD
ncbi:MAG: hypothetical protein ACPHMS_07935, partial [Candidatus Poseidoniaceae archaeon]